MMLFALVNLWTGRKRLPNMAIQGSIFSNED